MKVNMLKGKIHRATVVQAELNYVGSITVDKDLLDAAGIYEYEKVHIVDIDNVYQLNRGIYDSKKHINNTENHRKNSKNGLYLKVDSYNNLNMMEKTLIY